jgi:hypothetical protein
MVAIRLAICSIALFAFAGDSNTILHERRPIAERIESSSRQELERLRLAGDLRSERRHAWYVFARLASTSKAHPQPVFQSWYGEDALFAKIDSGDAPRGIYGFSRTDSEPGSVVTARHGTEQPADTPVLTYTLYNEAAYKHIRGHRLHLQGELEQLSRSGPRDDLIPGDRSIPAFPADAIVIKTAWWPAARDRPTALPVWDPERNPPRPAGNAYLSWQRVIAVDPNASADGYETATVDFVGQTYRAVRRIGLGAFYHLEVDDALARRLNRDRGVRKASLIALGRPMEAGDYLVLVGANLATKEIDDWVWAAFWWYDRPDESRFGADRTPLPGAAWRGYLLQVAFDSDKPAATDGGPHVCFNPWLEGRFPDGGHGGGTMSNCMTCHRRASYAPVDFLPVTRGAPDLTNDPAYAPARLRTNFIWAIALHARP